MLLDMAKGPQRADAAARRDPARGPVKLGAAVCRTKAATGDVLGRIADRPEEKRATRSPCLCVQTIRPGTSLASIVCSGRKWMTERIDSPAWSRSKAVLICSCVMLCVM